MTIMMTETAEGLSLPSLEDLEAYNAMAVMYEPLVVTAAESRVARLNRLAFEHGLLDPENGVFHVWFKWQTYFAGKGKPPRAELTLFDNRPKVGPLPFLTGGVRVHRCYVAPAVRMFEATVQTEVRSVGIPIHVFELLPGVQVSASNTPCAYEHCGRLLEDPLHYRIEVTQRQHDRMQRIADEAGVQLDDSEDDLDLADVATKAAKALAGDMATWPDSHLEWRWFLDRDADGNVLTYKSGPNKGKAKWVRRQVNVHLPAREEPQPIAVPDRIPLQRVRGHYFKAKVLDLNGHVVRRDTFFDPVGPACGEIYNDIEEARAGFGMMSHRRRNAH